MKPLLFAALVLSLGANAALLAALLRRPTAIPTAPVAAPASTAQPDTAAATAPRPGTAPASAGTATAWQLLQDRDPTRFAARLAAAGFPRAAQRGAVAALLYELQAPERERNLAKAPDLPFWQAPADPATDREYAEENYRLWQERERAMRRLFPEEQEAHTLQQRAWYGLLPADKIEQLVALERDYNRLRGEALARSSLGFRMPWQAREQAVIEAEKRRDLAALLSPEELATYDLHTSNTSRTLRSVLMDFAPSEAEFRALHAAQAQVDALRQSSPAGPDRDAANAWRQARDQATAAIQDALGPQRYAEYVRATDPGYRAAFTVTQERNLPVENARAAYQVQRDIADLASNVRSDRSLNPQQRSTQLAALAAEAERLLTPLLTPAGLADYRRRGGFWLRGLAPAPSPGR